MLSLKQEEKIVSSKQNISGGAQIYLTLIYGLLIQEKHTTNFDQL